MTLKMKGLTKKAISLFMKAEFLNLIYNDINIERKE
jgi:hypothetical protein